MADPLTKLVPLARRPRDSALVLALVFEPVAPPATEVTAAINHPASAAAGWAEKPLPAPVEVCTGVGKPDEFIDFLPVAAD